MLKDEADWEKFVAELDEHIRAGRRQKVVSEIKNLQISKMPRHFRAPIAEIARRVSESILALKILNTFIYPKEPLENPATAQEKMTYASTLHMLGLNEEALSLLSGVDVTRHPDVLLYSSFAYFGMWNYEKPMRLLNRYIKSSSITDYMRLVGQVNLIAAYVSHFEIKKARDWIQETLPLAEKAEYWLLTGNILELNAQTYIQEKKYKTALKILDRAEELLKATGGLYYALVQKWKFICQLMEEPNSEKIKYEIHLFQEEARENKFWEIVRDCDLYLALSETNVNRLREVVLGTPYKSFRQRAERLSEMKIITPHVFDRPLGPSGPVYNSWEPGLIFQPTLVITLEALAEDLYKPVSLGRLFNRIYPHQIFDPFTSPKRVMNTIYRLRKYLKNIKWPIVILMKDMEFYIKGQGSLRLYRDHFTKENALLQDFKFNFSSAVFSSQDFAKKMKLSHRLSIQIINYGLKNKILISSGRGPSVHYKFSNHWS